MSVIYWLRHGPTHQKGFVGWRDVDADLSDEAAIDNLAKHLPHLPVISSDLARARQTARAVAGAREILPPCKDLREFCFGIWEGLDWRAVSAMDDALSREYWERPGDVAPPSGESWNQVAARVNKAVDQLRRDHPLGFIAVAHMGVIMTQIARVSQIPAIKALSYEIVPLSVTSLDYTHGDALEINRIY